MLVRRITFYTALSLIAVMVLNQMGFKLTALLGAAGILTVAIGFAAQTSVSNIISGIFLISERPFEIGNFVKIGDTYGVVLSIDLLSVKLQTLDNLFVRIPNENILKSQTTNISRFPIRRMDLNISVAYEEDVQHVRDVLTDIAKRNTNCLDTPEPLILFKDFGDSALIFLFGIWFLREDYFVVRNSIMQDIKERFDAEGIEIPFPHRTLYTGAASQPFPIKIVDEHPAAPASPQTPHSDNTA
jgi:small-conductance mechanosensitive channel